MDSRTNSNPNQVSGAVDDRPLKSDRRLWMLVVTFVLLVAWGFGVIGREPYPLVVFPSFGPVLDEGQLEETTVTFFVLHGSDGSAQIEAGDLFIGAFDSFHFAMIESMVDTDEAGSPELEQWFTDRAADELAWTNCVSVVEVVESEDDPEFGDDREIEAVLNKIEFPSCS